MNPKPAIVLMLILLSGGSLAAQDVNDFLNPIVPERVADELPPEEFQVSGQDGLVSDDLIEESNNGEDLQDANELERIISKMTDEQLEAAYKECERLHKERETKEGEILSMTLKHFFLLQEAMRRNPPAAGGPVKGAVQQVVEQMTDEEVLEVLKDSPEKIGDLTPTQYFALQQVSERGLEPKEEIIGGPVRDIFSARFEKFEGLFQNRWRKQEEAQQTLMSEIKSLRRDRETILEKLRTLELGSGMKEFRAEMKSEREARKVEHSERKGLLLRLQEFMKNHQDNVRENGGILQRLQDRINAWLVKLIWGVVLLFILGCMIMFGISFLWLKVNKLTKIG